MPNCNSRCLECNSIITKNELKCYVCGEPAPGAKNSFMAWLMKPGKTESAKSRSAHQKVAARVAFFAAQK